MALSSGTRFGPYEVIAPLGAGGMGEVYRAADRKLGRQVALKVLPESVAQDADRLARFEREARTLASLNHPNIAQIYGLEERDGVRALVMELVEGPTLADRLAQGALRVDEVLLIADQICDALAAAHDRGVIHRDLKPANIMIGAGDRVKVLDFGLAKKLPAEGESALTTMSRSGAATSPGTQMGTMPYMSPEQVRGEPLDARTDLWAFGCVLYELLAGVPAFRRATSAETIAAILGEAPDFAKLPPSLPAGVRLLIERCLRKDPKRRLHHAADARIELADATPDSSGVISGGTDGRLQHRRGSAQLWASALLAAVGFAALGAIAVAWLGGGEGGEPVDLGVVTFSVPLPDGTAIGPGEVQTYLAVSPDGHDLVFTTASARSPLYHHSFGDATTRPLAGTEGAATPTWSPDGRFVAFFAEGRLKKVDVSGGGPPQVLSAVVWGAGSSWSRDGTVIFAQRTPRGIEVHRVSADGGEPSPVTTVDPDRETGHNWPHFLPDGRRFLYLAIEKSRGEAPVRVLYVATLDGGERRAIAGVASRAVYVSPGFLVYVAEGVLVARRFDVDRAEFTGEPVPLTKKLRHFRMTGQAEFSVSAGTGRSVLAFHGGSWKNELVAYDRTGSRRRTIGGPAAFDDLRISPDGRQFVAAVLDPGNGGRDLWVYDLTTSRARRLTLYPPDERGPVWSPDGRRIAFRSDVNGPPDLYVQNSDGGGAPQALLSLPAVLEPEDWSRDGRHILFQVASRATGNDLWLLPLDGGAPRPLLNTRYSEWGGKFSPNGRWVAFVSDESGASQVYLAPLADPGARRAVSTAGGISPRWRADGRELIYLGPNGAVMAVPVESSPTLQIGEPRVLFRLDTPISFGAYDVSPDGQSFVMNHVIDDVTRSPITVVLNWTALLNASAGMPFRH